KIIKSRITRKRYVIEQKLTLNTNRKSANAFQNMPFYLTCDATWRRNLRYVTSGFIKKVIKSRITRKRYVIEQKLTLITNRKSAIAIQSLPFYLTYDATWRRSGRYVSSDFMKNALKSRITWKRCTIEQTLQYTTYKESAIAYQSLSFYLTCDATWRTYRRSVTAGLKKPKSRIS